MNVRFDKGIVKIMKNRIQHYNHKKYWKFRDIVVDSNNNTPILLKYIMLHYIKKCDAFNCSSFGTDINKGAIFNSHPNLPHGLNGIIISHYAKFGKNCTIFQQVTVGENLKDPEEAAEIGDNVLIGTGAKIIGNIKIGNNVKIGANAVVVNDIPDNCTVVGVPAKIVKKKKRL